MKTEYQIIYWRDIPAQIKVRAGDRRIARPLSQRFQETIDRAAMAVEATSADDYLATWHSSDWQEREGDPEPVAQALAAELEAGYPPKRLESLELNGGHEAQSARKGNS